MSQSQIYETDAVTPVNAILSVSTLSDNKAVRGDGNVRSVQTSTVDITDNGEMTNPSQPAFLAYQATQTGNITGNGTVFILGDTDVATALIEVYDQNNDFNPGSSSGAIFTAPVTGRYLMNFHVSIQNSDSNLFFLDLQTSNELFRFQMKHPTNLATPEGNMGYKGSLTVDMDAADTAIIDIAALNGTVVTQVKGAEGGILRTFWSGTLLT